MATISLSGLPDSCKLPKLVILLKSKLNNAKFWIKEMADIRGTDLKTAKIEFNSANEAYRALKSFDGFHFTAGQFSYPVEACIDEDRGRPRRRSPSPYSHRPRDRAYRDRYEEPSYSRYDEYSRERSRSPLRDNSELDLEIELLRKKRMIIEEERRLLLERKKLELVQEFGPSALKEFKFDDDRDRERRYRPDRAADYRPQRRRSPPRPPPPRPRAKPASKQRALKERPLLPQFFLPCKILLGELKELMDKLGTRKESFLLTKLIRATIRKRIAVALEGKPIMSGAKIVALYREKYPPHQDEDFVKRHLNDVRACHMPSKGDGTKETDKNTKENVGNVDEVKEGEKNNGVDEKEDTDTNMDAVAGDIKVESDEPKAVTKEEPNSSTETHVLEAQDEPAENVDQAETDRAECNRSVGSSEALTLHDNNDEDWVEGEHCWDDEDEQTTPDQE